MKPTRRDWITHTGLGLLTFGAYVVISRVVNAPVAVVMPDWVPFLPWLAVPYLLQVVVSYFLVLAVRDRALRRASVGRLRSIVRDGYGGLSPARRLAPWPSSPPGSIVRSMW